MKTKSKLKEELESYFIKIESKLGNSLPLTPGDIFSANGKEYQLHKITRKEVKQIEIEGEIYEVFSESGIRVSGEIAFEAYVRESNSEDEDFISYCFKINLNPIPVKFDSVSKDFTVDLPSDFGYITVEDSRYC